MLFGIWGGFFCSQNRVIRLSPRFFMRTPTPSVYIRGLGVYAPERRLTNEELAKRVDTTDEWIRTRSGISERRIAAEGENPSDMGVNAALVAIDRAGIRKDEIDLIIC